MILTPISGFSDPFSSISHLLAAIVFIFYGIRLIKSVRGQTSHYIAVSIFVFTVVFLLLMSGIFHLLEQGSDARIVLQRLDHAAIFALIAGTFTPVHIILFKGVWRWGFLLIIWSLAIIGIVWKSIFFNEMAVWLGLLFYLGLGWSAVLSAYLTHRLHGVKIIKSLIYGGLAYTLGAVLEFIQLPIIIPGVLGPHELFHIAVIFGILWHWQFIRSLIHLK